jgi:hypothetical protein
MRWFCPGFTSGARVVFVLLRPDGIELVIRDTS